MPRKKKTEAPSSISAGDISDASPISQFLNWTTSRQEHPFYHYEPWDGPDGKAPRHTPGGSRFQLSAWKSTSWLRMLLAGNQLGKTYDRAIEIITMLTGELPYAFRYPEGMDTGIKRMITKENVRRWGRYDAVTREFMDHDENAIQDDSWNCGNIIGLGDYPAAKICKEEGAQVWVCTYKQARDVRWIDLLKMLIPKHCLDMAYGPDGFTQGNCTFHFLQNKVIRFITYEQKYERVEAAKVWHIVLDEEPPQRRFYTGCVLHCRSMSMSFTPLRGLSWAYTDLYQPLIEGKTQDGDVALFRATRYDCPYTTDEEVEREERTLKSWERDAKIYGEFSQQEGRPYYDYDLCQKNLKEYRPQFKLARIYPLHSSDTVKQVVHTPMNINYLRDNELRDTTTWEIYEDVKENVAYWVSVDCAKGNDDPDAIIDSSVAYVFRKPNPEEDPAWPVCVASLYTSELTERFAWLVLYGAIYYNHALLAPETKGDDGSAFHAEIREYPHWFTMVVIRDKDRKATDHVGFDTNARTRTPLFNKLRKWINYHEEASMIPHQGLLIEAARVIMRSGRPDHPDDGTTDCVVAWCIGLWIWEEAREQIRCYEGLYRREKRENTKFELALARNFGLVSESRRILGSQKGLDMRRSERTWRGSSGPDSQRISEKY